MEMPRERETRAAAQRENQPFTQAAARIRVRIHSPWTQRPFRQIDQGLISKDSVGRQWLRGKFQDRYCDTLFPQAGQLLHACDHN